jgi:hypothetical protein
MIDRKALHIFLLTLAALLAASLWQLSLGPHPQHIPAVVHHTYKSFILFAQFSAPAGLLMMMAVPVIQRLGAPMETRPAWRRWGSKWIVSWCVFWSLMQAFTLGHALSFVSQNPGPRFGLVLIGIIFMMMGNGFPKAPSQPQRNGFELDPWRQNRMLRFAGKLMFGLGLAFALGGFLLPLGYWRPVFSSLMLTALAAGVWYGARLRHEPRNKVLGDAR